MTPVVALDTGALMAPVELGVRLFDELDRLVGDADPVAPRAVIRELDRLSAGAGREATAASVGRDLVAERCRVVETGVEDADDALVDLARAGEIDYVVTTDRPLRDRVLAAGVAVVGVRGRTTLRITQP